MKRSSIRIIKILCMMLLLPSARAGDQDWQVWLDLDAGGVATGKTSAKARQSFRWKEDVGTLSTYFADFSVKHQFADWLDLAIAYRQQFDKATKIDWIEEQRPYFDVTPKWTWRRIRFSDRNRLEYRVREERDDEFRYRNKLTELINVKFTPLQLKPYLAQELFVDEGDSSLTDSSRFRFFVGWRADPEDRFAFLNLPPKEGRSLKTDLFLMYENQEKDDDTIHTYVVGFKFGVFF